MKERVNDIHIMSIEFSRCSKIWNIFLFLFSTKMFVIGALINKMFVRIASRQDPDQPASSEEV